MELKEYLEAEIKNTKERIVDIQKGTQAIDQKIKELDQNIRQLIASKCANNGAVEQATLQVKTLTEKLEELTSKKKGK